MQATVSTLAEDLASFTKHLFRSSTRELFGALQETGISVTQLKCLGMLSEADEPRSLGGLSDEIGLSLPAVSRAIDGLVQRGEVKRQEDPSDRRSRLISVTARGRTTYERLLAVRVAGVSRFVEGLEPAEREALEAVLAPIVDRMGR